ncbi:MAG: type II/IV secretion system protein [Sedimentisphaerales bacterium]|nr:type II/IV secretion system protein [Sedimentisphaerales bacterium]
MNLPTTDLCFNPVRFVLLAFWFYWCVYLLNAYYKTPMVSNSRRPFCNLMILFFGPLFVFGLTVVNAVKTVEANNGSVYDVFAILLGKGKFSKSGNPSKTRSRLNVVITTDKFNNSVVISRVEEIIADALEMRASDLLINPVSAEETQLRFRIDGMLRTINTYPAQEAVAIINSIKAISSMDVAEKRRAQDGAFSVKTDNGPVSFRAATAGVLHGEKISIRVLNQAQKPLSLKELGFRAKQLEIVAPRLKRNSGMILVCGPTGSGKSTTIYSMLRTLDFDQKNVITIEDPIEYILPNASQIEVNEKAGITFASTLRSVLRQDPDVIYIGEIRDQETAQIAMQAAQTGHQVFATLHSSSNAAALVRLVDLGVKPMLLVSAVDMLISQRLVKKLCNKCSTPATLTDSQMSSLAERKISGGSLRAPAGCKDCGFTGYYGRTGLFDIMVLDDEIKAQLLDGSISVGKFKQFGDDSCRTNMQKSAMALALEGRTDLQEVKRVVSNL